MTCMHILCIQAHPMFFLKLANSYNGFEISSGDHTVGQGSNLMDSTQYFDQVLFPWAVLHIEIGGWIYDTSRSWQTYTYTYYGPKPTPFLLKDLEKSVGLWSSSKPMGVYLH